MRVCFRTVALIVALASLFCTKAGATVGVSLNVTASPNPVTVNNSLTYTITVTNTTGVGLNNVVASNFFTAPVQFTTTNSTTTNITLLILNFGTITNGTWETETFTVAPLSAGTLTNVVFLANNNTIHDATNVLVSVVAPAVTNADLGVTMSGFPVDIFVNDLMTYTVSVTNGGPASAANVTLSNDLPPDVELIGISPTNQFSTSTNASMVLNLGTLTNHASKNIFITVQPTNSGVLTFSASINASGITDSNAVNNSVSSDITVGEFFGTLIATNVSTMQTDPQTGLEYQTVRLSNIGSNSVPSARVIVTELPSTNRLFNAIGTNNGSPFVVYGNTLETNQSVDLVLEYFTPNRAPFTVTNSQYVAVGINSTNFSAPVGTNGTFEITRQIVLTNGNFLIEFDSAPGKIYTILYSDDMVTWLEAQPAITAQANKTQWIDDGPPKTISLPNSRFYKIFLNP